MSVFVLHAILSALLFFIVNWIGKHSISVGYMQISLFAKSDEAPAFNLLIRVFTPVVFLIIVSAVFYQFNLDRFVVNIYLIGVYYVLLRTLFNLITNRGLLLNWYRQLFYMATIIFSCYFVYEKIIKIRKNLIPDLSTVSNELWVIVAIFLFQILNKVSVPNEGTVKRKEKYLSKRFKTLSASYGYIVDSKFQNNKLQALVYAIMIYEDFNRPKIIRFLERLLMNFSNKPFTLGIMQVKSAKPLSDKQSVELGVEKVFKDYQKALIDHRDKAEEIRDIYIFGDVIEKYNGGSKYLEEVQKLHEIILQSFYGTKTESNGRNNLIKESFQSLD